MEYVAYKGKSEEDLWLYLDELERLDLDIDAHTDIFDVMEEISQEIGGLRSLVERYSSTSSIHILLHASEFLSPISRAVCRSKELFHPLHTLCKDVSVPALTLQA